MWTILFSKEKCSADDDLLGLIGLLASNLYYLLNVSVAIFLEPCISMTYGLYSSTMSLHLMTLSVLNVLLVDCLQSVYILICCSNILFLHCFRGKYKVIHILL